MDINEENGKWRGETSSNGIQSVSQATLIVVEKVLNFFILHVSYYHLFQQGELDGLFHQIPGISIEASGYDRDNHYVIAKKAVE